MSCATFQRDQRRSKGMGIVSKGSASFPGDQQDGPAGHKEQREDAKEYDSDQQDAIAVDVDRVRCFWTGCIHGEFSVVEPTE